MPKKGVSRKAELQRRPVPSIVRGTSPEPSRNGPDWEIVDIRVSVVAKSVQTAEVDGDIGDLRPPPRTGLRQRKKHTTLRQWISYASQTRKGIVVLHGMIDALKRMLGG